MQVERKLHIAIFLATSGHSGVDRIAKNLIYEWARMGIRIDLLKVLNHGPYLDRLPPGCRLIQLGTTHVTSALPRLLDYIKQSRPDLLFTDKDRVNRVAITACLLNGTATGVVVRIGTMVSENLKNRSLIERIIQLFSMRYLYPCADAVLVPSHSVAEDLIKLSGLDRHLVRVVPTPVIDDSVFQMAAQSPGHPWFRSGDLPIILGMGELSERKDFATLIKAFAIVRKVRPCRLVILGKGRMYSSLVNLSRRLGIEKDVFFPGFVSNPYAYLSRAAVFVLASRYEGGMPVSLIEALSLGVPCVSTDYPGGCKEILQGKNLGILTPVGSETAMARAIVKMLDNPPDRDVIRLGVENFKASSASRCYLQAMGIGEF